MHAYVKAAVAALMIVFACAGAQAGSLTPPPGYASVDTEFSMPNYGWFGGFDILPSGNFVIHDGYALREITRAGTDVTTIYAYDSMVFGSFVKYNPANGRIYFGESSYGTIKSVALSGGPVAEVASLAWNFDIDFWAGRPYVVAGTGVYRLDESTGTAEVIAQLGEASGALIFDSGGNLLYGTGDYDWTTPRDQKIIRWSAAQVAAAGGGSVLSYDDAQVVVENVAPYGFAWSGSGELVFSETVYPSAVRLANGGGGVVLTSPTDRSRSVTYIRTDAGGQLSAAVCWFDEYWNQRTVISTLVAVPEPSSVAGLSLLSTLVLIGLRLRRIEGR